jgi:CRP/FNR family cyclic AMP-dependent transcriptional regulator
MAARKAYVEMLGRTPLFQSLTKSQLGTVLETSKEVDHPAGSTVVAEDDLGVGFHLIVDGTAIVSQKGRRLRRLVPGDSFGDIALIDGRPRTATVRAETPLRTVSMTVWDFKPLLSEHPQISYRLLLELCRRLREAEKRPPL